VIRGGKVHAVFTRVVRERNACADLQRDQGIPFQPRDSNECWTAWLHKQRRNCAASLIVAKSRWAQASRMQLMFSMRVPKNLDDYYVSTSEQTR
jgi:hypothetical protein